MASATQVLSVNAGVSRSVETKSAATEAPAEPPFGQVLAREVSRKGGEQQAGESAAAESAKTESASAETATSAEVQTTDSATAGEQQAVQDAAAMPWLLMMQQATQATQAVPQTQELADAANVVSDGAKATVLATVQGQGTATAAQLFGEQESTGDGDSGGAVLGGGGQLLAANSASESGKALPQDLSASLEKMSFSGMLAGRMGNKSDSLGAEDGAKASNLLAVGQPAIRMPESGGEQVAKTVSQHVVAEPVGDSRWGDAVAQRVSMMLGRQEQQVEMQLNPPHLGPMEVRLTLGQEQASVVFASQHAAVREALEAATPKLTALLADQGIQLVNVQVASDSLHQHAQEQSRQQQPSSFQGEVLSGQNGRAIEGEPAASYWRGDVMMPVARSGVSLYV